MTEKNKEADLSSFLKEGVPFRVEDLGKNEANEGGFETILTQLIEKIDKPSIKNSLKDSLIINKITNEGIYLITISKVAQLIFSNNENMKYIEDKLNEVMGKPLAIHVTFENKDSYFLRKLGNI